LLDSHRCIGSRTGKGFSERLDRGEGGLIDEVDYRALGELFRVVTRVFISFSIDLLSFSIILASFDHPSLLFFAKAYLLIAICFT
jgi:hypothetical protein